MIELAKAFLGFRARFHRRHTERFVERGDRLWREISEPSDSPSGKETACGQLTEQLGLYDLGSHEDHVRIRSFMLKVPVLFDLALELL